MRNWIFSRALARKERGFGAVAGATACTAGAVCGAGVGVGGGGSTGTETATGGGFCGSGAGIAETGISAEVGVSSGGGASGATGGMVGASEMAALEGTGSVGPWVVMGSTTGADCGSTGVCAGSGRVVGCVVSSGINKLLPILN